MASKAYRADYEEARSAVYAQKGKGPSPFDEGSRKDRLFHKWRRWFHDLEYLIGD